MPPKDDTPDTSLDAPIPEGSSLKHAMSLLDDAELAALKDDEDDKDALSKIAGEADPDEDEDDDEGTEGANPDATAAAPAAAPAPSITQWSPTPTGAPTLHLHVTHQC